MRKNAFNVLETFSSERGDDENEGAEGLIVEKEKLCAVENDETTRDVYLSDG